MAKRYKAINFPTRYGISRLAGRFVWIPKAGGHSFRQLLSKEREHAEDAPGFTCVHPATQVQDTWHWTPSQLVERHIITRQEWNSLWTFAAVRNPWDRMASIYYSSMDFQARASSLKDFIEKVMTDLHVSRKMPSPFLFARAQGEYLTWNDGSMAVDTVVELEKAAEQWLPIARRLDASPSFPHHHRRWSGNGGSAADVYDNEGVEMIAKHEEYVIERFGYQPPNVVA